MLNDAHVRTYLAHRGWSQAWIMSSVYCYLRNIRH